MLPVQWLPLAILATAIVLATVQAAGPRAPARANQLVSDYGRRRQRAMVLGHHALWLTLASLVTAGAHRAVRMLASQLTVLSTPVPRLLPMEHPVRRRATPATRWRARSLHATTGR